MTHRTPLDVLHEGVAILAEVLRPAGFTFVLGTVDRGSGGAFAQGAFVRNSRTLSFSMRQTLGLVCYASGGLLVSHDDFMRVVAPCGAAHYPGFSEDLLDGFRAVSSDLRAYGAAFVTGTAADCHAVLNAAVHRRPPKGFAALEFERNRRAL